MNNKMNELLEKYWQGETSLDEEKFIRTYFREGKVQPEHEKYKALFLFYEEERKIEQPVTERKLENVSRRKGNSWMRIAAILVTVIALGTVIVWNLVEKQPFQGNDQWAKHEVQDPDEARQLAEEALVFLSVKLNKGEENMRNNLKTLNKLPLK